MPDYGELPRNSRQETLWSLQNVVNEVQSKVLGMEGAKKLVMMIHTDPQTNLQPNEILTDPEVNYTYNWTHNPVGCGSGHSPIDNDNAGAPYNNRTEGPETYERGYDFHDTLSKQLSLTLTNLDGSATNRTGTYWNCNCPATGDTDGSRINWTASRVRASTYDIAGYDDSGFTTGEVIYGTALTYTALLALFPLATSKRYIKLTQIQSLTHSMGTVSGGSDNNCGCCNGPFGAYQDIEPIDRFAPTEFEDDFRQSASASFSIEIKDSNGQWNVLVPNTEIGSAIAPSSDLLFEIGPEATVDHVLPSDPNSIRVNLNAFGNINVSMDVQKVY